MGTIDRKNAYAHITASMQMLDTLTFTGRKNAEAIVRISNSLEIVADFLKNLDSEVQNGHTEAGTKNIG